MYETSMLRQAIGDWGFASGHRLFPASYCGFAICEAFQFWQAIGDLQEKRPPKALQSVLNRFTSYWGFAIDETSHLWTSYWGFAS